jgi:hypothetical protein
MTMLKIAATALAAGILLLIIAPNFCTEFALAVLACA